MNKNSNMYSFQYNQGQMNNSQLSKSSQMYQPNAGNYDMMGGNMMQNNQGEWSASNSRKLDRKSTVFIPGMQNNLNGQPESGQGHNSQKKPPPGSLSGPQGMANRGNMSGMQPNDPPGSNQGQWGKITP